MYAKGPLLPSQRRRLRETTSSSSISKTSYARIIVAIALSFLALISFSYFVLDTQTHHNTVDHSAAQLDSEHELYTLHNNPSPYFCARRESPPLVCAHGGDDSAPPNTLHSLLSALNHGANCLEIDVSMTKDGNLVALHDRDLRSLLPLHLANHPYQGVGDFTWSQLSTLEWKVEKSGNQYPISTLQGILETVLSIPSSQLVTITIDVKLRDAIDEKSEAASLSMLLHDVLKQTGCGKKCMVWGKSDAIAHAIKAISPDQRVGIIVMNETEHARIQGMHQPFRLKSLGAEVAGVHYKMISAELTSQIRLRTQREVFVWTTNTAEMMTRALDAGPDAVVTTYPRKVLQALESRYAACP